jgi:hypothetical protein
MHLETHAFPERVKSVLGNTFRGEKMYQYILSPPTGYLLLNLENLGRGTEGTHTFCISPSNFVTNFFSGTSLFAKKHLQTSQFN